MLAPLLPRSSAYPRACSPIHDPHKPTTSVKRASPPTRRPYASWMVLLLVFAGLLLAGGAGVEPGQPHGAVDRRPVPRRRVRPRRGVARGPRTSEPDDQLVRGLAELALFSVLFTDGMRVGLPDLRSAWRLPGRALVFGLPLTLLVTAVLAHVVAGLPWLESFLIGAVAQPDRPGLRRRDRRPRGDPLPAPQPPQRRERPQRRPGPAHRGRAPGRGRLGHGPHGSRCSPRCSAASPSASWSPASRSGSNARRFFSASAAYEPLNAFAIGLLVLATGDR